MRRFVTAARETCEAARRQAERSGAVYAIDKAHSYPTRRRVLTLRFRSVLARQVSGPDLVGSFGVGSKARSSSAPPFFVGTRSFAYLQRWASADLVPGCHQGKMGPHPVPSLTFPSEEQHAASR